MLRATSFARAAFVLEKPWRRVALDSGERHLRRKLITLDDGREVMVDLPAAAKLEHRDCLVLEYGRLLQIAAAP